MLLLLLTGCLEAPDYLYGQDLDALDFQLYSRDVGVYPDTSVLDDPNNPFAEVALGTDVQWDLTADEQWVGAFYAWSTLLATYQPTGESQYYTATALSQIYLREDADPDDLYFVWRNAVDGYQVVLDTFPDSQTYDATGSVGYDLAPLAYYAILALGGEPEGDWVEVVDADGNTTVVPGS